MASDSLRLSTRVPAAPDAVYAAWLDGEQHGAITGDSAFSDPTVGGRFTAFGGYISGTTLALEPGRRIVQAWRTTEFPAGHPDSRLEVLLEEHDDGGSVLTLVHSELPPDQVDRYREGWEEYYFKPLIDWFAGAEHGNHDVERSVDTLLDPDEIDEHEAHVTSLVDRDNHPHAPATQPPAAKKPVAKPPATKPPVAHAPVAQKPVAKQPAAKKPVAKKPVAKKPVAKKPVAKKPVVKKPVAKKPVAKKPVAKKPVAKKPVAKKPAKKPVAKKPAKKPIAKKPAKKPIAKKPAKRR